MAEAVLLNPYQVYADVAIDLLFREHGIRTIALHRDWRTRLVRQPRQPILNGPAIAAHYMIPPTGIASLAPTLAARHDVIGVVPHDEGAVAPLVELGRALKLPWAQQPFLTHVASKESVKAAIAAADPEVRLNAVIPATDPGAVLEWARRNAVDRFVLKPDAGSGNRGVAFFDTADGVAPIRDYFAEFRGPTLAEEFIGGEEYWINGQLDAAGVPLLTGMGTYDRRMVNGKENVEVGGRSIPTTHPAAGPLRAYAEQVMRATGLRRSPFHLEAKIDDRGPCLIEVGTRFCGEKIVLTDGWQLGADLVGLAVGDYVRDGRTAAPPLDFARYDSHRIVSVNGSVDWAGRIAQIDGMAEVEALPEFLMWIKQPKVGNAVVPTMDLMANPWSLYCWGADDAALDRATERVRQRMALTSAAELPIRGRLPVYADRVARAWDARPRPATAVSWWQQRRV